MLLTQPPLHQLIGRNYETCDRLAGYESIRNLRDVCDRDASVKKVIGFD